MPSICETCSRALVVRAKTAGVMAENWPAEALDALSCDDVYLGHGPLTGGVHVIRALCRDSLAARRLLETLRLELYAAADLKPPFLGRKRVPKRLAEWFATADS